MKILITDLHCASNRGDCAILEGILAMLVRTFPNAHFIVLTDFPEVSRVLLGIEAKKQKYVPLRFPAPRSNTLLFYALLAACVKGRGFTLPLHDKVWARFGFDELASADLIVSTGGSHINDFYSPSCIGRLIGFLFAKLLGKPVVLMSQSLGPFEKPFLRMAANYVLNRVDLITTRDAKSLEILKELKVDRPRVEFTADAAFGIALNLNSSAVRRTEPPPEFCGSELRVSISARSWGHYTAHEGHEQYLQTLAALADWLITSKRAEVVFLSTCTGFGSYHKDDRVTASLIIERMKGNSYRNPTILYNEYTPAELSFLYGKMDLHVGTRMHSNILALLGGTPVVALEYEFKTSELMAQLGLSDYVLDVNGISLTSLQQKVESALASRVILRETIASATQTLRSRFFRSDKLLEKLVSRPKRPTRPLN